MPQTWYISDTHFGHTNCWEKFKDADGNPMRPFTSTEEMDETMVERWNEVVAPADRVFHLGDVVMNKRYIPVLERLNGEKHLIIGNHDIHHLDKLDPYFKTMTAMRIISGVVFTHFPIHPDQLPRFGTNVHGHLHDGRVMTKGTQLYTDGQPNGASGIEQVEVTDPRYHSVCVEHTDYRPVSIDQLRKRIDDQQEAAKAYLPEMYEQMKGNKPWGNGSGPG